MKLNRSQRALLIKSGFSICAVFVALYVLIALKSLIIPIIVGALLAYLFKPLLNLFRYSWLPDGIRIFGLVSLFVGILFATTWMVRESLPSEIESLELKTRIQYKLNENKIKYLELKKSKDERNFFVNMINEQFGQLLKDIDQYVSLSPTEARQFDSYHEQGLIPDNYYQYFQTNIKQIKIEKRQIASSEVGEQKSIVTLAALMNIFSIWIIMPLAFVFLLFDKGELQRQAVTLVPNKFFELTLTVFEEVNLAIGKYLRGTFLECLLVGISMFIGLFLIGFDLQASFLISLFGGLVSAIPIIGTVVGLAMSLCYAMIVENAHPLLPFLNAHDLMLGVCVVMVIVHFLDSLVFQPLVVGSAVNLHPMIVILGVIGGSMMFGFAGMMFAIPAIVVLKVSIETLFKGLKDYHLI